MSKNILDKKIPSLGGIGVLAIGLIVTTLLVKGPSSLQVRANPASEPKNIEVTNISDSSFTVVYTTKDSVLGTIKYGETPESLNNIALDQRDQLSQEINEYKAHSITVSNLTPNTNYFFTITSDNKTIKNNKEAFVVKTGPIINSASSTQIPITGKVINPNDESVNDGLVVATINGAQKISGIIKENGEYTIPLNNLRTVDLINYYSLNENTNIDLYIDSNNLNSKIKVATNQTSPVPIVTLSKNYNFLNTGKKTTNSSRTRDVSFPEFNSEIKEPTLTPIPTSENL